MKSQTLFVALLLLTLFGARAAQAQITPSNGGYLFRSKLAKGQKLAYDSTLYVSQAGAKEEMLGASSTVWEVIEVKGKFHVIKSHDGTERRTRPAKETALPILDDRNRFLGMKMDGRDLFADMGLATLLNGGEFPEKPVKVGETFTVTQTATAWTRKGRATVTYKFLGIKTVGNRRVAQLIVTNVAFPAEDGANYPKITGFALFDLADGSLVTLKANTTFASKENPGKAMTIRIVTERK